MSTVSELMSKNLSNSITNVQTWGGIVINVKAYGAKGDGSTDDTSAIQEAIDAAIAEGKKEVIFPYGSYVYTTLTNTSEMTFIGDGVVLSGTTTITITSLSSHVADTVQRGINVLHPPNGLTPVNLDAPDNSTAINAMIEYLSPGGELFFPVGITKITNPIIITKSQISLKGIGQRSIIQNDGTGDAIQINGTSIAPFSRIKFDGLRVTGSATSRYGLNAAYVATRLIIRDCEFSGNGDAGAWLNNCYAPVINSSNFSGNCLQSAPIKNSGLFMDACNGFDLSGVHCVNNGNNSDGARINSTWTGVIGGCQFETNARYGLNIMSCKGITINGAYVEFNTSTFQLIISGTSGDQSRGIVVNGGIYNGADVSDYGIAITNAEGTIINAPWALRNNVASIRVGSTASNTIINNPSTSQGTDADPALVSDSGIDTQHNLGNLSYKDIHIVTGRYLRLGAYYYWTDANGVLRVKSSVPSSDTDGTPVAKVVSVPALTTSAGQKGDMAFDATHLYYCYGTNTWRRIVGSSW